MPDPNEIVQVWRAQMGRDRYDGDVGTLGDSDDTIAAAGLLSFLDPRPALRMFTVWQMKDRAGRVGAAGVQPLLRDLLAASERKSMGGVDARLHLLGHSYGGKVMLSAVGHGEPLPRKVESILLLQPAVSHLCFALNVPGSDNSGGYRPVLDRVVQPVLATFSSQDIPLHDTFHLALRRKADLGEAQIANEGEPPSRYAALGGYGPRGTNERLIDLAAPPTRYIFEPGVLIYGLNGTGTITGHGEISNRGTWWTLYNQLTTP